MDFNDISQLSEDQARNYLEKIRWPEGTYCAHCGSLNVVKLNNSACGSRKRRDGLYKCRDCRKQFTVTVGTIFEGARIPIRTWLLAFSLMCASKKGISAHQLHRMLGITYKSAWFMAHRVRYAMAKEPLRGMLKGIVEVDETYVGGKPKNYRRGIRAERYSMGIKAWSTNKTPLVAIIERNGNVRTRVVANITGRNLKEYILQNVNRTATINTDEHKGYIGIDKYFDGGHKTVKHSAYEYVRGDATINTAESFFSLLKRGVIGTFHKISKEHLQKYGDEFSFRWDFRKTTDEERTIRLLKQIEGKQIYYREPLKMAS